MGKYLAGTKGGVTRFKKKMRVGTTSEMRDHFTRSYEVQGQATSSGGSTVNRRFSMPAP
jgi:hypothetical protein